MKGLLTRYNESDIVCFATPICTWNMTALLKNFADRLAPLKCPHIIEDQGNFDLQDSQARTQKFVILSNCGFPGENNFEVVKAVVACCGPSLEIYRNCGKLLKGKEPSILKIVEAWLRSVEQAGREMVLEGKVSKDTEIALRAPMMSVQEYVAFLGM